MSVVAAGCGILRSGLRYKASFSEARRVYLIPNRTPIPTGIDSLEKEGLGRR